MVKINGKLFKQKNENKLNFSLILGSVGRMLQNHTVLIYNWFGDFKQKKVVSKLRTETYLGTNQGNGRKRNNLIATGGTSMYKGLKVSESARISWTVSGGLGNARWLLLHTAYSEV